MAARVLESVARRVASTFGRDSRLVRPLRPAYEAALRWAAAGRGIRRRINGVPFRIDPAFRAQLAEQYDAPVADYLRRRVRPGSCCVDVGANVGVYVLQFAHWCGPAGRVVAFEPNPAARRALDRHVALNGLRGRVEVVPHAVGAAAGEATLWASGADGTTRLDSPNQCAAGRAAAAPVPVSVTSLDDFCEGRSVDPDWLLIDIEGFELAALRGARRLIARRGAELGLVVEMHPNLWASAGADRRAAGRLLDELGLRPVPLTGQRDPLGEHGTVRLEYAAGAGRS